METRSPNTPAPSKKRLLARCLAVVALAAVASGCVNSKLGQLASQLNSATNGVGGTTGPSGSSSTDNYVIGNMVVAPTGSGGSGPPATIYFDPSHATAAGGATTPPLISQHCALGSGSAASGKPCLCQYTWSETNASSGNNHPFTRTVTQPVTNVQQQLVACSTPDVFATEITDGTTIKVSVIAGSGNADSSLFTVKAFNYVKTAVATAGSFQDAQGHTFDNIVHYSCYEQFKIGTAVQSKMGTKTNSQTGETTSYPLANQFCVQQPNQQPSADCPNLPAQTSNSAQAYYYNFFVRVSSIGSVNQWNDRYSCPSIKEPIYNGGSAGSQGQVYPQDTNFALSIGSNTTFNVGVNGFVELSDGGGDPISQAATLCDGTAPAGNGATDGFVQACLGFAAKPSSDGTCPYIRDSSGAIRFTYRLRRFIALYPPLFGIDGKAPKNPQRTDTIYVLDRPVTPPLGASPLKPYTMRGPKPCPFSLFDSNGVLGFYDGSYPNQKLPIYAATNNSFWNGKNVDGIQFPNYDSQYSCSTALPLVLDNTLTPGTASISIGTINQNNPVLQSVYVRPIHSWAPHYEEDVSFQACAPQASPVRDPPMHFAKDLTTGNVSWCAEVYPSQNDNVASLDSLFTPSAPASASNTYIGHVKPFTSHVVKNSASADCKATIPSSIPKNLANGTVIYPPASGSSCVLPNSSPSGVARHPADMLVDTKNNYLANGTSNGASNVCADKTCDRTAIVQGVAGWPKFPILASAPQVEQAISADTTYGCVMTYDSGGPKTGKTTPFGGCCGANVTINTGFKDANGNATPGTTNMNAHLEPDTACLIPQY